MVVLGITNMGGLEVYERRGTMVDLEICSGRGRKTVFNIMFCDP